VIHIPSRPAGALCSSTAVHRGGLAPTVVMLAAAFSLFLAAPVAHAARDAPPSSGSLTVDRFEEDFVHLHVHPSTHRAILNHASEAPTLEFTFSTRATAEKLLVTLPPGYVPQVGSAAVSEAEEAAATGCGIFTPGNPPEGHKHRSYSALTGAKPLAPRIAHCEILLGSEGNVTQMVLHLRPGVQGLSEGLGPSKDLSWWFFHARSRFPAESLVAEENVFRLQWSSSGSLATGGDQPSHDWEGGVAVNGWPILGDWNCKYSEWEGWGACSARCGGGVQHVTRRILLEPPEGGAGEKCNEQALQREVPCNEHPCLFPCEFVEEEQRGVCTAVCGGGVRAVRRRWLGDNCPKHNDDDAVRWEPCNTEPCQVKCRISDVWKVASQCSELCGEGNFWLVREVLQKDPSDRACQAEWRQATCLRQHCNPLTVLRPDQDMIPFPGDVFRVAVLFELPVRARKARLSAPEGFVFGEVGQACDLHEHDMLPHFQACTVNSHVNEVELTFSTPLPPSVSRRERGRYNLLIDVVTEQCNEEEWVFNGLRDSLTCVLSEDKNRWKFEYAEEGEGSSGWSSLPSAEGFNLQAPFGPAFGTDFVSGNFKAEARAAGLQKETIPAEQQASGQSAAAGAGADPAAAAGATASGPAEQQCTRPQRPTFCSPRLPCPGGATCSDLGICPSSCA